MATRKKSTEVEADLETKELEVKDSPAMDPIAAATAAITALQSGGGSGELEAYPAGKLVDTGKKVFLQSDLDDLQAQIDSLQSILDYALVRGDSTLNNQSSKGFDTLDTTGYWRYTGSAINNPIANGYGIIINIRYTAYAVQLLFSQTGSTAPVKLLYRMGVNMSATPSWGAWMEISATALS